MFWGLSMLLSAAITEEYDIRLWIAYPAAILFAFLAIYLDQLVGV